MSEITTLIAAPDNSEIVRDKLAEILLTEEQAQRALAEADPSSPDPNQWKLRVFLERSNPWEEFLDQDTPAGDEDFVAPIVNISLDSINYDPRSSNVVSRQKAAATYNIDCYGYGVSTDTDDGHDPGDARAILEAQRAVRLVRNILMAAAYTYLGLPRGANQVVWKRWLRSVQMFQPSLDGRPVQHVAAARLQLEVEFNEFSPQVEGAPFEVIYISIERGDTGEVFLVAKYGEETTP